jgi:hypothetical protein
MNRARAVSIGQQFKRQAIVLAATVGTLCALTGAIGEGAHWISGTPNCPTGSYAQNGQCSIEDWGPQ